MVSATECFRDTVANDAHDDLDRRLSVFKFLRRLFFIFIFFFYFILFFFATHNEKQS